MSVWRCTKGSPSLAIYNNFRCEAYDGYTFHNVDIEEAAWVDGVAGSFSADPKLVAGTYELLVSSPCVNNGGVWEHGFCSAPRHAQGRVWETDAAADGTKVSMGSRLILSGGVGPEACVPLFVPLYGKKGWVGGLLWLDSVARTVTTERDAGCFVRWENSGKSGPDGFSALLDVCGGYYGTGAALAAGYLFGADAGDVPYFNRGDALDAVSEALPDGIEVIASGSRLSMIKGTKPAKVEGEYAYEGDNPSLATLSYAARTGLFKGKFYLYYDGEGVHKAVSVPYAGVLTPVRDAAFDELPAGMGHALVPDNDPAVKAYRLKRSRPVWLEVAP